MPWMMPASRNGSANGSENDLGNGSENDFRNGSGSVALGR